MATRTHSFLWALGIYGLCRSALTLLAVAMSRLSNRSVPEATDPVYAAVVAPWHRWDVEYYVSVAEHGYGTEPATTTFHPLYGWLGRWPAALLGDTVVGLLVVSGLAAIGLLVVLERWSADEGLSRPRLSAGALFVLPAAFIVFAPYSESLFLLSAALCLWMAHRRRWWLAGAAGFIAGLTRQQGVLLALPLLWEMCSAAGGWRSFIRRRNLSWCLVAAFPLFGFLAAAIARVVVLGGLPDAWWLPQNWAYAILLSPQAHTVVPGQALVPPWVGMWRAIQQILPGAALPFGPVTLVGRWTDLIAGAMYLAILVMTWKRLRVPHRVYCLAVFVLAWSFHTGDLFAYMGLPRHLLLAIPLVLPIAEWASTSAWRRLLLQAGAVIWMGWLTMLYVLQQWVP